MRRLKLSIVCLFLLSLSAFAQVSEVEYWFDDNYQGSQAVSVVPSFDLNYNAVLDVSSLVPGLHVLNFRFPDNNGYYSSVESRFFVVSQNTSVTTTVLTDYEYWFDSDYEGRQTGTLSHSADLTFSDIIDVSALSNDLHVFHIRFTDDSGQWSSVTSHFFRKTQTDDIQLVNLQACQYWVDDGFGESQTQNISSLSNYSWIETLDVSTLENGLHSLSFRFQDNLGQWSSVNTRFFRVSEIESPLTLSLDELAWWWDDNIDSENIEPLTGTDVNWNSVLDLSGFDEGLHLLSFRVKDTEGQWSVVKTHFVRIVVPRVSYPGNPVEKIRYWLNDDFDQHVLVDITNSSMDYIFIDDLPLQSVSAGNYIFRYQFADSLGRWSVPMHDSIEKMAYPWIAVNLTETEFCGTGEFQVAYDTADVTGIDWNFGDGDIQNGFFPSHMYSDTGTYYPSVTVHHDATSQSVIYDIADSIRVYPEYHTDSLRSICSGDSVLFQGSYYHEAGIFLTEYYTVHGCDSTYTLDMTLNPLHETYLTETRCDGDSVLFDGIYLTESGNYEVTLNNEFLCDSTVYLDLIINPLDSVFLSDEICAGDSLLFEGVYISSAGEHLSSYSNQYDCDSVRVMNLTVNPRPETPLITQDVDTLYTSGSPDHFWYFDGELLTGENDSSLVCSASGEYFVIVGNAFSCLSDTSEIITVILNSYGEETSPKLSIYPNPVQDHLYIDVDKVPEHQLTYTLFDMNGRVAMSGFINQQKSHLNLSEYADGTYVLIIHYQNTTNRIKLIKQ